ncbi:O-methyltransferase [Streptomyces xantholiticus]|uniref:Class I SAM-dependent methyltransferase n=1 Tax=Streptomyces xantholiticus TaxID=68285 RepID=A0ABV1UVD6_9ACTN
MADFGGRSGSLATTAAAFVQTLGWSMPQVSEVLDEYQEVESRLNDRYKECALEFPVTHGVEAETGAFLYAIARLLKPKTVVETGVADGRSSFVILSALERNGSGALYSFDIRPQVGKLVGHHPQWHLQISKPQEALSSFVRALRRLGAIDLFFHDSDHRYLSQLIEYEQAWRCMTPGSVFASDDVDDSRAFLDFCDRNGTTPSLLLDRRKVIGAVRR